MGNICGKSTKSKTGEVVDVNSVNAIVGEQNHMAPPRVLRRDPLSRIFVNRSLYLEKICYIGFDMDYTLAVYHSPQYESMTFKLLVEKMIELGYPSALRDFDYDPAFPVRGLWFDSHYGTLLKMDQFGNILVAVKGFKVLSSPEIKDLYPTKFLEMEPNRTYIMNTLFDLPDIYLLACLVDYFTNNKEYKQELMGVRIGDQFMSFASIRKDLSDCKSWVHTHGSLKKKTISMLEKFIYKDNRLPVFLDGWRQKGVKTFLVTNSEYYYTYKVMSYLLGSPDVQSEKLKGWTSYFDYVIVEADKPNFFTGGRVLKEIDQTTGQPYLGLHTGSLQQGKIYCGGDCDRFSHLIGSKGQDVLYVGDHIFGDILMSRTKLGWKTFLVIPELVQEIYIWTMKSDLFKALEMLEAELSNMHRNLDSTAKSAPSTKHIQENMKEVMHAIDMEYGMFGSLFRSGSRQTFFASQVSRYADLYSGTFLNLLNYPPFYFFKAPHMLMPHESTVQHDQEIGVHKNVRFRRSLSIVPENSAVVSYQEEPNEEKPLEEQIRRADVPHARAKTPKTITHSVDVE